MDNSVQDKTAFDKVQDASLKYSGLGYLVGDAALFAHGMINGDHGRAFTGLSWGVGGVALAKFGKKPKEYQLKQLAYALEDFFQREGIDVPAASHLHLDYGLRKHWYDGIEKFCYNHPSELLNGNYAIGATSLVWQGMKKHDPWETASGALVLAGALSGLLTKENKEEASPDDSLMDTLQKNPLALSGALYTLNNVTLARSAWGEQRANPANKTYLLKYVTVATYVLANTLLGMSSKESAQADAQPEAARGEMIEAVAEHLAGYDTIKESKEQIVEALEGRIRTRDAGTRVAQAEGQGRLSTAPQRQQA
jgi:hypothetical protein